MEQFKHTKFPKGTFPVSIDVVGLYNNIPNEEGLKWFEEALNKRKDKSVPTNFLVKLKKLILTKNVLEFDNKFYLQLIGVAMGAPSAPTYANICMAVVDTWLETCALDEQTMENLIIFLKRFIDDFLIFWQAQKSNYSHSWTKSTAYMTHLNLPAVTI